LFYFPFSLGLFKFWREWKKHALLVGATLFFVLIHSLIPHKEERFLYPVIGLTLMMMSILWAQAWNMNFEKKFFRPVFYILNTALLGIGCFVNTQVGEIGPAAQIQSQSNKVLYIDRDSLMGLGFMHELFLRPPARMEKVTQPISAQLMDKFLPELQSLDGFALLTSNPDYKPELDIFRLKVWQDFKCSEQQEMNSLTDTWLYKMNSKKNYRRRPTWFVTCWR
jgi:hypothetical protein